MEEKLQMHEGICQYHMSDHAIIGDLKESVKVIIDGQSDLQMSVIQLAEAFKNMDRIEDRLEKIEIERRRQGERRDAEIKELRAFMNRSLGWAAAAVMAVGVAVKLSGLI